jgi:hypothetical protein
MKKPLIPAVLLIFLFSGSASAGQISNAESKGNDGRRHDESGKQIEKTAAAEDQSGEFVILARPFAGRVTDKEFTAVGPAASFKENANTSQNVKTAKTAALVVALRDFLESAKELSRLVCNYDCNKPHGEEAEKKYRLAQTYLKLIGGENDPACDCTGGKTIPAKQLSITVKVSGILFRELVLDSVTRVEQAALVEDVVTLELKKDGIKVQVNMFKLSRPDDAPHYERIVDLLKKKGVIVEEKVSADGTVECTLRYRNKAL